MAARLDRGPLRESWKTDSAGPDPATRRARPEPRAARRIGAQLRLELAEYVDKAADQARTDPDSFFDVDLVEIPDGPFDPLSFTWFCEEEREILARLAVLEVH